MNGYKVFNDDWTCRGYKYEVGKSYEMDGEIKPCESGFHFCAALADCYNYYGYTEANKVAEVEAYGDIETDDGRKYCTNRIRILREVTWDEVKRLCNIGRDNSGINNTGNWNTGDRNTGNWNTGDRNTGNWNTGDRNTGNFCTQTPTLMFFDEPSDWTYQGWVNSRAFSLLAQIQKRVVDWISEAEMTDEEKKDHPESRTTGGYLKVLDEHDAAQIWWDGLGEADRQEFYNLPNFDKAKFEECVGIKM